MDRGYAAAYGELYRRHWWWRAREAYLLSVLRRLLGPGHRHRLLDVGCGSALFFDRLGEFGEVRGVEPDTDMRTGDAAVDRLIHWASLETFSDKDGFSAVLFLDVLEHLADPVSELRRALSLLRSGGILVATVPAFPSLWTRHDDLNDHVNRFTKKSFAALAESAGCRPLLLRYFFHWLFLVKLGVHFLEPFGIGAEEGSAVPSVPPAAINRALLFASRAEQALGLSSVLPFGSSLLFVGHRRNEPAPELPLSA
jgi:SAM-dependent methyltransferase